MKGRGNYLCLHRFESFAPPGAPGAGATDRVHLALIEDWLAKTDTGDRAEIEELPEDVGFWRDIAATTENCLGSECSAVRRLLRHRGCASAPPSPTW